MLEKEIHPLLFKMALKNDTKDDNLLTQNDNFSVCYCLQSEISKLCDKNLEQYTSDNYCDKLI